MTEAAAALLHGATWFRAVCWYGGLTEQVHTFERNGTMQVNRLLRASALMMILAVSPVAAQDAEHQEHRPGAAAEANGPAAAQPVTKPAQEAMSRAAEPGTAMGQGTGMMPPGASSGSNMAMMRECMGMMGSMMQGMGQGQMAAAAAPDDPVEGAFAAINRRMHRDMAVPAGVSPDAAFAQAMITHHEGAIDMARVILGFGSDPEIRKLAQEVITAQQGEIAFLQQWMARQPKP